MSSRFRVQQQARVRGHLRALIPALSGVSPDDELGNFDIALAWAEESFEVHQFMGTNTAVVEQSYSDLSAKLRVHSRLDAAAALTELVGSFLGGQGNQPGGTWRFPSTNVIDLPHVLLSLLIELSDSPVHCAHTPTTLKRIQAGLARADAARWESSTQGSDSGAEDEDTAAIDELTDCDGSSLSDWSDDATDESESAVAAHEGDGADAEPGSALHMSAFSHLCVGSLRRAAARPAAMTRLEIEQDILTRGHRSSRPCQLADTVARHYSAGQAYHTPWPYSSTTEWMIVREAVLMLLGEPGSLFELRTDSQAGTAKFCMRCKMQVLHLSPMSLEQLLAPLTSVATDLWRIRLFCGRHVQQQYGSSDDGGGRGCKTSATVQAFAQSTASVIEEKSVWLRELDMRMMKDSLADRTSDGSLLRLRNNVRPLLSTVNALTRVLSAAFPPAVCGDECSDTGGTWDIKRTGASPALLSTRLLDSLYTALQEVDGSSSNRRRGNVSSSELILGGVTIPGNVPLYQRLLVESMRPHLLFLRAWLHDGVIHDTFQEFVVSSTSQSPTAPVDDPQHGVAEAALPHPRAKKFWTRAYSLRRLEAVAGSGGAAAVPAQIVAAHVVPEAAQAEGACAGEQTRLCIPKVLHEIADDILIGGKSVIIIAEDTTELDSQLPRHRKQLSDGAENDRGDVHELFVTRLVGALSGRGTVPQPGGLADSSCKIALPLPNSRIIWDDCLVSTVMEQCQRSSRQLVQRMLTKHKLVSYLDALHACFFMGDGFFMSEMSLYCCATLASGEPLDDLHTLHSLFTTVLGLHGKLPGVEVKLQIPPAVAATSSTSARRSGRRQGQAPPPVLGIDAMDGLFVDFQAPWPISLVINGDSCIQTYNRIMRLLLQVKRAEYTLTGLFVDMRFRERDRESIAGGSSVSTPQQQACLFHAELMHFVRTLHFYLMNRLAHAGHDELVAELHAAPNMEAVIALHDRYLSRLLDQCLLAPKARYVMDAVLKILDIILEVNDRHRQLEHGQDVTAGWMGDLPKRFHRLHTLLRNVLRQVVLEGTDNAHFEDLSLRLNYNQFYDSSRVFK